MKCRNIFSAFITLVFIAALSVSVSALYGDVNDDDYIGTEDAVATLNVVTGIDEFTEEQARNADVDCDGTITTNDVRLLLRGAADIYYIPDHFFSDFELAYEPTCTETGLEVSTCLYCDKTIEKEIPATGHKPGKATCTEPSYCKVCEKKIGEPLGHKEKDGYCTRCGKLLAKPTVTYKGEVVNFGCSKSVIKSTFGTPKDTLKDEYANPVTIIYVYYTDYADLGIFTFTNGKLTQFFTNDASAKLIHGNSKFSLKSKTTPTEVGDISVYAYKDNIGTKKNYCYYGVVGEAYTLKKTTNFAVAQKLNFHLTNGCRAINDMFTLKYSYTVAKVAVAHSKDMANRNFFSHKNPDGLLVSDRITNAGIDWRHCGENIAAGYYDPYEISNGWYNSSGHRSNLLSHKFKYMGVGIAYNEKSAYKYYSTQNFYNDTYVK